MGGNRLPCLGETRVSCGVRETITSAHRKTHLPACVGDGVAVILCLGDSRCGIQSASESSFSTCKITYMQLPPFGSRRGHKVSGPVRCRTPPRDLDDIRRTRRKPAVCRPPVNDQSLQDVRSQFLTILQDRAPTVGERSQVTASTRRGSTGNVTNVVEEQLASAT